MTNTPIEELNPEVVTQEGIRWVDTEVYKQTGEVESPEYPNSSQYTSFDSRVKRRKRFEQ